MGIVIEAGKMTLVCDEPTEMFCRGFEHFTHEDGFIGMHSQAMGSGWLERQSADGRKWLCPTCSGKR